jgi:hypothetical protein
MLLEVPKTKLYVHVVHITKVPAAHIGEVMLTL